MVFVNIYSIADSPWGLCRETSAEEKTMHYVT
jgi:hypothetical protein